MLTDDDIAMAADALYEAEKTRFQITPISRDFPEISLAEAYRIQEAWVSRKLDDGDSVIGYKIGLTSRAMQLAMNIDQPDYGVLLRSMLFENGANLFARDFLDPKIEVELAFIMKKKLFGADISLDEVIDATDFVVPALELIAARSIRTDPKTGYTRRVMDTIADNAANAGVILGDTRIDPSTCNLPWAGAMLYLNDGIEETGLAGGVLGHPAEGIIWVCHRFAQHGIGLEPGQIILSGSFTRPVAVAAGDQIFADFGHFGSISVNFK